MKFSANKILIAIRDGLSYTMILAIVGSIFMLIASLPIPGWPEWLDKVGVSQYLWQGVDGTFNLLGLLASFTVAYSYAKQCKQEGIGVGILSFCSFLIVTPLIKTKTSSGIDMAYMGAKGMFTAVVIALVSVRIYKFFIDRDIKIKMPASVPPAVSSSFVALIPGVVICTFWLLVYALLDTFKLPNLHNVIGRRTDRIFRRLCIWHGNYRCFEQPLLVHRNQRRKHHQSDHAADLAWKSAGKHGSIQAGQRVEIYFHAAVYGQLRLYWRRRCDIGTCDCDCADCKKEKSQSTNQGSCSSDACSRAFQH